ncbi:MAG: succinylglutamate desuccinylase [Oceanospirillaceae bacterium]|uniref:DUF1826 domain-containing protein n=1 Tax=unclassified Thalassolituus TaxID=2624967 RepID=UPI000C455C3C|nr:MULTISPECIES: DUF1826 domain-containing protein [unclassified Thalassolituus]MAS25879.1 succinylglutamate desuccinylase [Oceanospirillaceae bacterium]MBS52370.1 succinylglutamate desuccinylase [Oceanospirillaceae bacterium]|tara:strand:+ start:1722 stop:2351 length:630 start_codon:yes stop_codon:yes gene_type:complete
MNSAQEIVQLPSMHSGDDWNALTYIYEDYINLAVSRQVIQPSTALQRATDALLQQVHTPALRISGTAAECRDSVLQAFPDSTSIIALADTVYLLADAFSTLFDLQRVGLRLDRPDKAMCPRFHVDRVPARMITTLSGVGTEWLTESAVDRSAPGRNLHRPGSETQQLNTLEVALMKGEEWQGNERRGLVHRSPDLNTGEKRLVLTLDFA